MIPASQFARPPTPARMSAAVQPVDRDRITVTDADEASAPTACGAKIRKRDAYCGLPPGFKTPHAGAGRCYLHGGLSHTTHGRYSRIKSTRLLEVLQRVQEDQGDPLDLTPDVEMLRSLFIDYIERYDENTTALLAWYESYEIRRMPPAERAMTALRHIVTEYGELITDDPNVSQYTKQCYEDVRKLVDALGTPDSGRPRQILDITDAKNILAEAGKMVERIEKIRAANAISRPELNRIYQEMWRAVDGRIEDDNIKAQIKNDWLRIAL